MREPVKLSISELRQKQEDSNHSQQTEGEAEQVFTRPRQRSNQLSRERAASFSDPSGQDEESFRLPFDPLRLFDSLKRRWYLWVGTGIILFALG
ncbi:MAG: hypothetical protein ABIV39_05470, partial [Verrucomicrobiota bacterium]